MFESKRAWWCLALCVSSVSFAQAPRPSVMPFPLEIKRTTSGFSKDDKEGLQREYGRLLRLAGADVPEFARHDLALKELKRQDCEREDECLMQLAKKAEALYALYASLDYTVEGAVVATGRVVRDDGKVVRPTETIKLPKGKDAFKDIAKNALTQLLSALKLGELPTAREVEKKVEPVKVEPLVTKVEPQNPPPLPPPLVIEDTGAGQRSMGKTLVIVGGGLAVVGAIVSGVGAGVGYGSVSKTNPTLAANAEAAKTLGTAQTLNTAGFVGLGIGAATAAVGAVLWGVAPKAPVSQVAVVPVVNGAVVQLGGQF